MGFTVADLASPLAPVLSRSQDHVRYQFCVAVHFVQVSLALVLTAVLLPRLSGSRGEVSGCYGLHQGMPVCRGRIPKEAGAGPSFPRQTCQLH